MTQAKTKLQTYMRKQLVDLNNEARLRKKQLKKSGGAKIQEEGVDDAEKKGLSGLIEFLLSIDRDVPAEDFFSTHGEELFNIIFKLTFYNDEHYAITNNADLEVALKVTSHDDLSELVKQQALAEARVNIIVNNLLVKQILATRLATEEMR